MKDRNLLPGYSGFRSLYVCVLCVYLCLCCVVHFCISLCVDFYVCFCVSLSVSPACFLYSSVLVFVCVPMCSLSVGVLPMFPIYVRISASESFCECVCLYVQVCKHYCVYISVYLYAHLFMNYL